MYDAKQWALLPNEAIVQQYSQCLVTSSFIASREKFPVIEVGIHIDSTSVTVAP